MYLDHPCYDRIIDGDPEEVMDPVAGAVEDTRRAIMAEGSDLKVEPISIGELLDRYELEIGRSTGFLDPPGRTALDKKPRLE